MSTMQRMTQGLDFYNHFDASQQIGNKTFVFFSPIELGEWTVQLWTSAKMAASGDDSYPTDGVRFSLSIYGPNGAPTLRDERLTPFRWFKLLQKSWQDDVFSKEEVEEILYDLHSVQRIEDGY